jgi:hypothetical protein
MTVIACLGWGSLIWNPGVLRLKGEWSPDGPDIRVEFLRRSQRGNITLVLDASAPPVRSLWAIMDATDIRAAATNLREREEIPRGNEQRDIGRWQTGDPSPANIIGLPEWAQANGVDGVVWTALGKKFHESGALASAAEIVAYLKGLDGDAKTRSENYIRYAPRQTDTPYRREIETALGWTAKDFKG